MINRSLIILLLFMCSATALSEPRVRPNDWAQPIIGSSLSNFYRVDEGLFRSEQPGSLEFSELVSFGIREILNLREYHSNANKAKDLNLTLHRLKLDAGSLSEADLVDALYYVINRQEPMLVHCWHGSDRTGAVIAAYRIIAQGWTKDQAIEELVEGGFGYHEKFFPNIVDLVANLNIVDMKQKLKNKTRK